MSIVADVLVALIAALHISILVLEMFLWRGPAARAAFGMTPEFAEASAVLAANQGLLFVLSMVVIGGLVGGGGLGFLVINGFSQYEDFGKGLAAGIAITALGIMLDRITVHTAARYGRAEN